MQTRIYLTAADHARALSWDEFIGAEFEEGYRYEMIEGRIFVSPVPNVPHDVVVTWLLQAFYVYKAQRADILSYVTGQGRVFLPDTPEGTTAPEPDVACYAKFAGNPISADLDWRDYSPVLVVEVLSADSEDKDLNRNRRLYLQIPSIREYWIVDPRDGFENLVLMVYRRRGDRWAPRRLVSAGATYTTPLLPDFSLLVEPRVG